MASILRGSLPRPPSLCRAGLHTLEPTFLQGGPEGKLSPREVGTCLAATCPTHTPSQRLQHLNLPESVGRPAVCLGGWCCIFLGVSFLLYKEGVWIEGKRRGPPLKLGHSLLN